MSSSLARSRAPSTLCVLPLGESSKSAERPVKEGLLEMRLLTIDGVFFEGFLKGAGSGDWGGELATSIWGNFVPGEASGDSEGKDSSVLAEVGVTREGFLERALAVLDFREAVEIWDEVRSILLSLLLPLRPPILVLPNRYCDQRSF